jgi:hypothetical protein
MEKKDIYSMRIVVLLILAHVAMFVLFYSVGQLAVAYG